MNFKEKTVYQIYPKSFQDSNGDGWGDLQGVISRLDYLQKLGIEYIWFNAMFVSPQRDNGYDVEDYRAIDPRYGTMEDFTELCREAKKRGIDIMLDMVFNHASTRHVWFQKALKGEEKYKDYFFFRKGKADGSAPNNWNSKFGGPAWEYVKELDEYYLHLYDVTQADLNWDNPEVRKELADIVNFWRSKGVHGFRFDVVNLVSKGSFEDDPNLFDGRQFYTDGPHIHEYLKELNLNSFGKDEDSMTVGEMSSTTLENCTRYSGSDAHELTSVFTFHHLKVDYRNKKKWELMPFDFMELKQLLNDWQTGMQEADAWNALFWCNHDQPRAVSRFGDDSPMYRDISAKMIATCLHMLKGSPYIYQGEEIGMTNAYFKSISDYRDIESINAYKEYTESGLMTEEEMLNCLKMISRDNARTPMQWDDSANAGFTTGTPWISVNKNYTQINAKAALEDKDSVFYYYQKLIRLRHENEIIVEGVFHGLLEDNDDIYAYERTLGDEKLVVACNFTNKEVPCDLFEGKEGEELITNYKNHVAGVLQPYETRVILYK